MDYSSFVPKTYIGYYLLTKKECVTVQLTNSLE